MSCSEFRHGVGRLLCVPAVVALGLVVLGLGACTSGDGDGGRRSITVSAAASLTDVLTELGGRYEAAHPGVKIVLNFAGSNQLARQILEGAPVDLFFSANVKQMGVVAGEGRLREEARWDLLGNRLVVIAPSDRPLVVNRPADLAGPAVVKVGLCDGSVPVGAYARAWLESQGLMGVLRPRLVRLDDVRQVLAAVEAGNVDLGFVYATDATLARRSTVVWRVPDGQLDAIVYPLAVLRDARDAGLALAFAEYLRGSEAAEVFTAAGFDVAP